MSALDRCHVEPLEKAVVADDLSQAKLAYLDVFGMGCKHCATRVKNSLLTLKSVLRVDMLLDKGVAVVAYDPARVLPERLVQAVKQAGQDGRHDYHAEIYKIADAPKPYELADIPSETQASDSSVVGFSR